MIKAIMAVDDKGGVSKNGSMPWPKNVSDLKWFKNHTLNNLVIMGRMTWIDPLMPSPLKNRINVLITNQEIKKYPGAQEYISGDLVNEIKSLSKKYDEYKKFVIGGPKILEQLFELVDEFYLTRIYGDYNCDKFVNLDMINNSMDLKEKINNGNSCHFEIWKR